MSTSVPDSMTAIEITEPGGPEVLKPSERPVPPLAVGEVLLKVAAAGRRRARRRPRSAPMLSGNSYSEIMSSRRWIHQ